MLEGIGLTKKYRDRASGEERYVLRDCSLTLAQGESLAVMGPSGCGKSTLARIMLRLIKPDAGRLLFRGQDISSEGQRGLREFRRTVQYISQRPESFFDPLLRLGTSLLEPASFFDLSPDRERMLEVLELVKLNEAVLERYPHQVSGGEIQRLSLARALLLEPRALILDEPTSMLDVSVQAQLLHLLQTIRERQKMTYLLITHDPLVADYLCDRTLYLQGGQLSEKTT